METVKIKRTVDSEQKVLIINISNKDSLGVYNPLCKNEVIPNYIYSENKTLLKFIHKILLDKDYLILYMYDQMQSVSHLLE